MIWKTRAIFPERTSALKAGPNLRSFDTTEVVSFRVGGEYLSTSTFVLKRGSTRNSRTPDLR